MLVTWIYRWTQPRAAAPNDSLVTTLALLTLLTAMSTQVIGDSVARAFSLVGASLDCALSHGSARHP